MMPGLPRVAASWDRFWFSEASPVALALFRIVFALALLLEVETSRARSLGALASGFHWPYVSWIPQLPEPLFDLLHTVQYPLILLLGVGLALRLSCAGLLVLQGWIFFADRLQFRNHPWFFLLVLLLLLPSPAAERFSVSAWLRSRREGSSGGSCFPLTCQRLIQLQVSIVYVFAALHKLHPAYLTGDVLRRTSAWAEGSPLAPAFAIGTVVLELVLPVALWLRSTRPWAMAAGVAFHGAIAVLQGVGAFSLAIVASYLLFFDPDELASLFARRGAVPRDTTG